MHQALVGSDGRQYQLGEEIASGGEGRIFTVTGIDDVVAKLYHAPPTRGRVEKLTALIGMGDRQLRTHAAWPSALLSTLGDHRVVGFTMPRLVGRREIHTVYGPSSRMQAFPQFGFGHLVAIARNVCVLVDAMHNRGIVIGDFNQKGWLVDDKGFVSLIDTDSLQVSVDGKTMLCHVGVPEYTPPELHGTDFTRTVRTANHDCFGLAVLVFHLLFLGRHPFAGQAVGSASGTDLDIAEAIRRHRFAYGSNARALGVLPPRGSLPRLMIQRGVGGMFERAFSPEAASKGRPSASEWLDELEGYRRELISCPAFTTHHYPRWMPSCTWCELQVRMGRPMFAVKLRPAAASRANLDADGARAALLSCEVRTLPVLRVVTDSHWEAIAQSLAPIRRRPRVPSGIAFALALVLAGVGAGLLVSIVVGTVTYTALTLWNRIDTPAETQQRRRRHDAKAEWRVGRAAARAWLEERQRAAASLAAARREVEDVLTQATILEERSHRERARAAATQQAQQRQVFLRRFTLAQAQLYGIGESIKQTLIYHGVETAADISSATARVPGIGPTRFAVLSGWAKRCEAGFVQQPGRLDAVTLAALENRHHATTSELAQRATIAVQRLEYQYKDLLRRLQPPDHLRPWIEAS